MITLARTFFWLHSGLCLVYLGFLARAMVGAAGSAERLLPSPVRLGDVMVVSDERAVNLMLYVVLGLFLLYAEIYMYRVYLLTSSLLA